MARVQNPQFISSLVNCKPYKPRETPDFDRLNRGFYTFGEFDLCSSAPSSSEDKVSTELDDKEDELLLLRNQILCLVFFLAEPNIYNVLAKHLQLCYSSRSRVFSLRYV